MDHQHTLKLNCTKLPSFMCSGCKEQGAGTSFICENSNCNYILHKECAEPVKHAVHPFFKNCNFEFIEKSEKGCDGFCDGCGKDFSGFIYLSKKKGFSKRLIGFRYALHPCCLNLKENILNDDGNVIMTLSHEVQSECVICNQRDVVRKNYKWLSNNGWSYVFDSDSSDEKSCIHVSCIKDMVLESLIINKLAENTSVPEKCNNNQEITTTRSKERMRSFMKFSKKAGHLTMLGVRLTMLFTGDVTSIGGIVGDVTAIFAG
ncbi:unnamed protein product [Trifolium pratense]|uniref:Uncharacterized protein n=1 Tax=Trifolium pratense TaxID=57577 RepID=A0ACB0LM92_TRIPR|nr:unnamed protein product [Trifolium pratense]